MPLGFRLSGVEVANGAGDTAAEPISVQAPMSVCGITFSLRDFLRFEAPSRILAPPPQSFLKGKLK